MAHLLNFQTLRLLCKSKSFANFILSDFTQAQCRINNTLKMSSSTLPPKFKQLFVKKNTTNFRDAVKVEEVDMIQPKGGQLLIKNRFVGVNASDINMTAGRYHYCGYDPTMKPPYPLGFEALGNVVGVGEGCDESRVGQSVIYMQTGAYSEYTCVSERATIPVKKLDKNYVCLLVSGLTASMALEQCGRIKEGETVLVTAAAGGTGQFAVQLAKLKGCHVIGTCSTKEKAEYLKGIGCDRPVIYTQENLKTVLKTEYPKGVDVIYESIGGEMFETALKNIAMGGRLIVIGTIGDYQAEGAGLSVSDASVYQKLPAILISKSATIVGFFLLNQTRDVPKFLPPLISLHDQGKLHVTSDQGEGSSTGKFVGLDMIADAVEHIYSKKSLGKVVVELNPDTDDTRL